MCASLNPLRIVLRDMSQTFPKPYLQISIQWLTWFSLLPYKYPSINNRQISVMDTLVGWAKHDTHVWVISMLCERLMTDHSINNDDGRS